MSAHLATRSMVGGVITRYDVALSCMAEMGMQWALVETHCWTITMLSKSYLPPARGHVRLYCHEGLWRDVRDEP